jgi:TetR/AcrR family transcriptional regulator, copper-responsive repressor
MMYLHIRLSSIIYRLVLNTDRYRIGQEAMMEPAEKTRGRPRSFDPAEVLDKAQEVFWRQGYDGTSYTDLTAATGLNKPSLYAAFGDKEALFAAALQRYNEGPTAALVHTFEASPHLREGVEAMMRGYADLYTSGTVPCGCMAATTLAESSQPGFPEGLKALLQDSSAQTRNAMLRRAMRAKAEGELPPGTDPDALVDFLGTFGLGIAAAAKAGIARAALQEAVTTAMLIFRQA